MSKLNPFKGITQVIHRIDCGNDTCDAMDETRKSRKHFHNALIDAGWTYQIDRIGWLCPKCSAIRDELTAKEKHAK